MEFNKTKNHFITLKKINTFFCYSPSLSPGSDYGEVECWKNKLNCSDATSYQCSLNDSDVSSPKYLEAVSSVKRLVYFDRRNKWSNDSGYLCEANAVLPEKKDVTFQWEIGRYYTDKTDDRVESVTVPALDKCYTEISSFYPCNSLKNPGSYTFVKCTVFQQTREVSVYSWTKLRCNTGSVTQFSKWVLVINLIILLLAVAISR
ncbi:Hypothetical predicted protein [Octopus vulgaris]|uniref:Uncharacterized protein n=1 Tax=Octopus vulgaris TaxID=6645 RepID=A0AA36BMN0_OCTVU|nr:Hypothetical predicted protein [Octopus vulgaris]